MIPIPQYIPFTQAQKEQAAATDLEAFLQSRGEKLIRSGREKRLVSDHSVTIRGGEWYDHAEQRGGNAISFLQRYYNMSFPDAVQALLGGDFKPPEREQPKPKPFALPEANTDMRRVFAYLTQTRGIDSKILLRHTIDLIATKGYRVGNIDATVCAEHPKLNPHIPQMQTCLARVMGIDEDCISIKATTTERLGFTGREEGISAYATALIEKD